MFYKTGPDDELYHYGMPRRSGRYPWGSGDSPFQRTQNFFSRVEEAKRAGASTDAEIAKALGISTTDYKRSYRIYKNQEKILQIQKAKSLASDGLGSTAISRKLGVPERTVAGWLKGDVGEHVLASEKTADEIIANVEKYGMLDLGKGVEQQMGVPRSRLDTAIEICKMKGYPVYKGGISQINNPKQQTNIVVVGPKDSQKSDFYSTVYDENGKPIGNTYENIHDWPAGLRSDDGGVTFTPLHSPMSVDSSRIQVVYAEDGGKDKDGVIELRRGVEDISLGDATYAQVRIAVDGKAYAKGMAMYAPDLPDGVDIRINSNKSKGTPLLPDDSGGEAVLKPMKRDKDGNIDPDNPFGATIKPVEMGGQRWYVDKNGEKKLSAINKVNEEGDWSKWSNTLASQFLSKQTDQLVKQQLGITYQDAEAEYDRIMSLNNKTLKRTMLNEFADACDGSAVYLKAAALPRQSWQVILPVPSLKDNEVYAKNYKDGEEVALVRYPHAGVFEIPILKVNNKQAEGQFRLGDVRDAIGINPKTAKQLSGADFDGDSVLVIPISKKYKITATKAMKDLVDFDPSAAYPAREGMVRMTSDRTKGIEMGKISNLITDMTLQGAPPQEVVRAVKHSMVVIDAKKHNLDYKRSEEENGIKELKDKYQGRTNENGRWVTSAGTLISRAKSPQEVPERKGSGQVNLPDKSWYDPSRPVGAMLYKQSGRTYPETKKDALGNKTPTGKYKVATQKSTKMMETDDARTLLSRDPNPKERAYASFANKMKRLAEKARVSAATTGRAEKNKSASEKYAEEVSSLMSKLKAVEVAKPLERKAQRLANAKLTEFKQSNPGASSADLKRKGQQFLTQFRVALNSKKPIINITPKEYEAIQSGALSDSLVESIFKSTDSKQLWNYAYPKRGLSASEKNLINNMKRNGYSMQEISDRVGRSVSYLYDFVDV